MSFNGLLGYCAPAALDHAIFTGRLQDTIKALDQPDRRQLPAVLHLRQVRGRAVYELGERVQAQPLGRPEPPDLSAKLRPPGGPGVEGFGGRPGRPAPPLGDEDWSCMFATCRTSSPLDGKPANKLSCPLQTARCGSNTRTVPAVRTVPFCEEAPCSGTRRTNR